MAFNASLTGLYTSSQRLGVFGFNLANLGSTGFKASNLLSGDLITLSGQQSIGGGSKILNVQQNFSQGPLQPVQSNLAMAIDGQGFFILEGNNGRSYTRNGQFQVDKNGFLQTLDRQNVLGYTTTQDGLSGDLQPLKINEPLLEPKATSNLSFSLNLNSTATSPQNVFNSYFIGAPDPNSYNFTVESQIFDSLGNAKQLSIYFSKTTNPNEFEINFALNGQGLGQTEILTFDSTGHINGPSNFSLSIPNNFSSQFVNVSFANSTQFTGDFSYFKQDQDGYGAGKMTRVNVDQSGLIQTHYSNGQTKTVGKLALAHFNNPNGLQPIGNNQFQSTFASGEALIGSPGNPNLGHIQSGFLESSNTMLTQDFLGLMLAQRDFEVNIKVIEAEKVAINALFNLR